jgi:DNA-binding GntR family transcriptional regulator
MRRPDRVAERLVHDTLSDQVAARLRTAIMRGELRAGETLRLVPVAASLGVSPTPVREALLALSKEGLVIGEPRRGFRVARLDIDDIRDLFLLHAFIAGVLAERAASALDDDDLGRLAELNAAIAASLHRGDRLEAAQLSHEFHRVVNKSTGPSVLHRLLADMARWTAPDTLGWSASAPHDHGPLLRALRRRDGSLARRLAERHVHDAGQGVAAGLRRRTRTLSA